MSELSVHDLEPQLAANRRYWTGWTGTSAGPNPGSDPDADLPTYRTDLTHPLLNGVLRVRDQPLDRAIETARERLAGSVWSWWVGPDSDPGTSEGLIDRGATEIVDMPIMAIDLTEISPLDTPAALKIQPITGREEMTAYVGAYAGPLGIGGDLGPVVDRELDFAYHDVVRLGGRLDGRLVGTCTLSLGTEVAALYCIATDPLYRRFGVATALTLEALRIARQAGRRIGTLQATAEGEPVYRRIGFQTVARYRLFSLGQ
jgi:GNAT superfamily N-acetyltransferase